jgi:hypothetical protein
MKHRNLRGGDLHAPSSELIENNTGATIGVLQVVKFNGMGTLYPQVILANSATDVVRGITQSSIANGATGYITSLGLMNGVNTSAWTVGTTLYCDIYGNVTSTVINTPIGSVLSQDPVNGIIYVNSIGITKAELSALQFPDALSLELAWDILYASNYAETTYDGSGKLTQYNIWDSSAKAIHIFNKTFTYTGSNVTKVVVTRVLDGQTLEKDITYNMSNQLVNVTRTYTP